MTIVFLILISVAIILLGAVSSKPIGYIAIGLALLAFLIAVVGSPTISFG